MNEFKIEEKPKLNIILRILNFAFDHFHFEFEFWTIFATMMQLEDQKDWFATWFNSPYYHVLYQNRDENEACEFLEKLSVYLDFPKSTHILDLACGAGRHSRVLGKLGYKVSGCDLSENSIAEAKEKAPKGMVFFVHDMRNPLPETYGAIFNLFTSFGYFDDKQDNLRVLQSVHNALETDGTLVIDFMNATKVTCVLQPNHEIQRGDILFHIQKGVVDGKIVKDIAFEADGQSYFFQEKVQILTYSDFETMLHTAGFEIQTAFGSYALEPFSERDSDRLILICKKP